MSPPSRQIKLVSKQDTVNNGECIPDCRSENGSDEPDVIINCTSPPEDITKYVHRFLEYVEGEHVERDITRETKALVSKTMALHVRYESLYVSLPSSANQEREMTEFCVLYGTWTTTTNFWYFLFGIERRRFIFSLSTIGVLEKFC